jgi:oligopeptide transport system permease protein
MPDSPPLRLVVLPPVLDPARRGPDSRGLFRRALARLGQNRPALAGLALIALLVVVAGAAPVVAPFDPRAQDLRATFREPSLLHGFFDPSSDRFLDSRSNLLGTDNLGRDWLSRLVYGARVSITVGLMAQLVVLAIGLPVGLVAGYAGGRVDAALMRFTDLIFAFPELLLIILLRSWTGGSVYVLFLIIGLASWTGDARLVRGQVLALKQREFVTSARCLGARESAIVWRHILPNALGPLIVATTFGIPRAMFIEASLSFMGIGVNPGTPSWGSMVQEGYGAVFAFPHLVIAPALAISTLMLAFTFVGDGLRDALDPRTSRRTPHLRDADAPPRQATRRAALPRAA